MSHRVLRKLPIKSANKNPLAKVNVKNIAYREKTAVQHPDGKIFYRPGLQLDNVYDDTAPLEQQEAYIKKRIVENFQDIPNNVKVIGDPIVLQGRRTANAERMKSLFYDDVRPFLDSTTRNSPIYKDVTDFYQRTPRVVLPSDTATALSPTSGVLHAYRMNHIRQVLALKRLSKIVHHGRLDYINLLAPQTCPEPKSLDGFNDEQNAKLKEFTTYYYHMARIHAGERVAHAFTQDLIKISPLIAKIDTDEVISVRRRRK